ncbi:MAG: glycerol transport system permease protein [bacterium]|jgi:glycerol transport system permease protein
MKTLDNRAWWLVLPAIALLVFVGVIPILTVVNYSLHDIFTLPDKYWVGFEWYSEIIRSERFHNSLLRSLTFSAVVLSIQVPLGIAIALALPRKGFMVSVCLVVLALPLLVPWNMIPVMWLSLLNKEVGLIATFLQSTVGFTLDWKFNALHTWIVIVIMDTWHWTSLVVILCYSSLSTIPDAYYRAAAIDSAGMWQVFRYIQLPSMQKVMLMIFLLRFIDSFMIYTEAFRINAGGPRESTMFLAIDLGQDIAAFNYGPSAARSVIYFLLILTVAWAFNTALNSRERSQ